MIEQLMECRVLEISNTIQVFYSHRCNIIQGPDYTQYKTGVTVCKYTWITLYYIVHSYTLITSVHKEAETLHITYVT